MKLQPVIKWSGSKRSQAEEILKSFPDSYSNYVEPFIGGGSILGALNPEKGIAADKCQPLIELWLKIQSDPIELSQYYKNEWGKLQKDQDYYYKVRDRFNTDKNPNDFLFLTRTCFNGLIRFNNNGVFNSSLHVNRPGIHPEKLDKIIIEWSNRIKNINFYHQDCFSTLDMVKKGDLVYLDPPYANTKGMYESKFSLDDLFKLLEGLNSKGAYWVLSFDGKSTDKDNTISIPVDYYKNMKYTRGYNSSFARMNNIKGRVVEEALYSNF